jgi:hypothetical protein
VDYMSFEQIFNKAEKPKNSPEDLRYSLDRMMEDISKRINQEFSGILKSDCSVDMRQWQGKFEGPYSKEDIKEDEKMILGDKITFSHSSNLEEEAQKKAIASFEERRSKSKPALLEKALVGVFDKILREKFLVARASEFDDYKRSVDTLVVDKETGSVVCAFDEVRENGRPIEKIRFDEKGNEIHYEETRTEEKDDRVVNKARQGGARIKYGFSIKNRELVKTEVKNIPMFRISLSEEELDKFLYGMDCYNDQPTEKELEVFDKLIASLSEQMEMLKDKNIHPVVARNLVNFEKSLVEIKNLRKNFG